VGEEGGDSLGREGGLTSGGLSHCILDAGPSCLMSMNTVHHKN